MAAPDQTPNLHLSLGADDTVNSNWRKIDQALGAYEVFQIIPNNVQIQGDLEVTGNEHVFGNLTVDGTITGGLATLAGVATPTLAVTGTATLQDLVVVDATPSFVAGSIDPTALKPLAAVHGVWI